MSEQTGFSNVVREAEPGDIPSMVTLERGAATAAHWLEQDYFRIFSADAVPRLALVLEEKGSVVGFLVAAVVGDEWEIENVVVAREDQRRGLGTRLITHLLTLMRERGGTSVLLEVRESNIAARALYEKRRFEVVGRRPAYYADPVEDAVVYRAEVGSQVAGEKEVRRGR